MLFNRFNWFYPRRKRVIALSIIEISYVHKRNRRMALVTLAPGNSPVFAVGPVGGVFAAGVSPTLVSSDTTNAPVVPFGTTGTEFQVNLAATATVGATFTLTASYTNPDGVIATGSATYTIVAAALPDVTSLTITQVV